MKRVEARGQWTLFRSNDVPDLHETYGAEFERRYTAYEERVAAGELHGETIPALELWKQMLKMLFETGHPWLTFKDPCNVRSPQDHAGVIHSSNLCTEITLNTGPDETAVCNLGSIVLDQHLLRRRRARSRQAARDDPDRRARARRRDRHQLLPDRAGRDRERPPPPDRPRRDGAAVRALPARRRVRLAGGRRVHRRGAWRRSPTTPTRRRPTSPPSAAPTRSYPGSKWDRGLLPQDTVDLLEDERGEAVEVPRGGRLDWAPLRAKIAAQGMRNSQRARDRPHGHDREHHGHLALHRADLQEPVRQVEPLRRLHRAQPVPRARPQGRRAVERRHGRAAEGGRRRRDGDRPRPRRAARALPHGLPDRARRG